jgi:arylsulfatase A-like enzyme
MNLTSARASILGLVAALTAPVFGQSSQPQRPNVVLIMTDDAGYADLGVYGATDLKTPHIDGLARDGVRFTDFYANGSSCTPTRAGLISGRYQQRFTLEMPLGAGGKTDHPRGLPVTGRSLPQLLKNHGYRTALIGKWHLGWTAVNSPNAHGFEYFFGFKSGYVDYYQHTAGGDSPLHDDLFENDQSIKADGYMTDLITERSIRFIEQNASRPFFVDVAFNAPHWPYQRPDQPSTAPERSRHMTAFDQPTNTRADYIAMLERVDQSVGRILAAIDKAGLRRNTIVIYTNDNGGEWLARNTPLFHHKFSVWEGGIRVPAIVRWPARIPAGQVSGQVAITMDLTASILAAAEAALPPETKLDGINLLPVLEKKAAVIERTLFWRSAQQRAVRSGDWKLMVDLGRPQLFNLRNDAGERANLIGERPEIARRLRPLLEAWAQDVDAEAKKLTSSP